jgi:hypothetical protein
MTMEVNEPVAAPVTVSGTASFDDMEALEEIQTPVDKELAVEKPMVPEVVKKEEEEKKEEAPKSEEKKEVEVKKKIKGKLGDVETELDLDVLIPVTIDGKEEMVSLSDIRNGFSGQKAISKRFSEIDKEKKTVMTEKKQIEEIDNRIKSFSKEIDTRLDSENPYDAIDYLVEKAGKSSYDFKYNKLLPAMMDEVVQLLNLDEGGREAYLAKKENEYLKKGKESESKKFELEKTKMDLIAKVDAMRETHKISEDEYVQAHNDLLELGTKTAKPETVIEYVRNYKAITKSIDLVKSIDPSKAENDDVVKEVAKVLANNPEITEDEITAELRAHWGLPPKAIEEKAKSPREVQNTTQAKKNFAKSYESFDDYNV